MDRVAHKCWLSSQPDRWTEGPAQVPGQGHLPRPRPPEAGSGWGDPGAGLQILSAGGPTDFRGSCLPARLVPGAHSKPESSSMAAPAPRRWTAEHPGLLQEPDGRALGRSRGRGPPGGRGRGEGTLRWGNVEEEPRGGRAPGGRGRGGPGPRPSQRRLLLLQRVRRRVARRLQGRQLEQRWAAARAGPLKRAPAVHAARRRRPRVRARQPAALRPRPRLAVGRHGERGRGRARGAHAQGPLRRPGPLSDGRGSPRGRASGQRHVGARVTCGRGGVSTESAGRRTGKASVAW